MKYSPLLIFHIVAGTLAVLSGFSAQFARKGAKLHRVSGNAFFISMLAITLSGVYIAAFIRVNPGNLMVGALALYLVATGWLTVLRKAGQTGLFEYFLLLLGLAVGAGGLVFGWQAAHSPTGLKEGYPPAIFLILGMVAWLCAVRDILLLRRGGVSGAPRIGRHLLRMGLAFLLAALAFFGRPQIFPEWLRQTHLLALPVLTILAVTIYWMIRVRFTKLFQR